MAQGHLVNGRPKRKGGYEQYKQYVSARTVRHYKKFIIPTNIKCFDDYGRQMSSEIQQRLFWIISLEKNDENKYNTLQYFLLGYSRVSVF